MNGEKMTPTQRWHALLNGEPIDRVPVFPFCVGHTAIINGYGNVGAYWEKPEVSYQCQRLGRELYGYEQTYFITPPGYGAAEWGSKILFPYNPKMGSVATIDPIVKTPEDVDKLQVPDPKTAPYFKELTETTKKIAALKEPLIVPIQGGLVTAVCPQITHVETFMRWLIYSPDLAKKLLAKSREFGLRCAEYWLRELGADRFILLDATPTDSNVLISPKLFGEIVMPSMAELHQKALDMGVQGWFTHWCSNHNGNIKAGHVDKIPMGKPGIIQFGPEVDLKLAVERFGNKNIVMGNVDPPSIMLKTHEECVQLAKQDIDKGKRSPMGYILGVGCECPPRAPPANVYALLKAAREYGRY
jgi:uroporphyrinogen decarboxylase